MEWLRFRWRLERGGRSGLKILEGMVVRRGNGGTHFARSQVASTGSRPYHVFYVNQQQSSESSFVLQK